MTTDRRTPAAERPATGMARAKASRNLRRAGALLIARGLLVEQLSLLHQSGRAPAAGRRPTGRVTSPATGRCTTATSRRRVCSSPSGRRDPPDSGTGPTPREVAQIAIEQMHLSAINIGIAPSRVRTASAWSACRSGCGPRTRTPTPSALSPRAPLPAASRHRDREGPRHHLGHGRRHRGRLQHGGHAVQAGVRAEGLPDCGHTYRKSSAGQTDDAYTVTATSSWVITWSGAGQTGTIRLDGLNRSTQIRIGEAVLVN